MEAEDGVLQHDWDLLDTRHVVFKPQGLTAQELEAGYWRAYRDFYRWGSIWRGAASKAGLRPRLRHLAYAGGWEKVGPPGGLLIRPEKVVPPAPCPPTDSPGFRTQPAPAPPTPAPSPHPLGAPP